MARSEALAPAGPARGGVTSLETDGGQAPCSPRRCSNAAGYKETNNPRPPGWGSSSRVSSVMGHGPRFAVTEPRLRDLAEKRWSRSRFGLHLAACLEPSSRACQQSLPEVRVPGSRLTPSLLAFDPLWAVSKAFIRH